MPDGQGPGQCPGALHLESFEHAVPTRAPGADAWAFWSDLGNHMRLEPGVERIELDGPYATGATGRTVAPGFTREWRLSEVVPERRFSITGRTTDRAGALSFTWEFEDDGGTRMTQRIQATGPEVEHHMTVFRQMELGAQAGIAWLAAELDRLAGDGGVGVYGRS